MPVPTAPLAATGLIGGYVVSRRAGRPLGGAVLAAGGAACARLWLRRSGPVATAALVGVYVGGFGASHLLARRIGAWPAVLSVAGLSAGAASAVSDRRG
jgi:hypothetical protein